MPKRRNFGLTAAACGGSADEDTDTTTKPTETTTTEDASAGTDVTEDLRGANAQKPWVEKITLATQTEPERLVVETSIVDPREGGGSAEAKAAIQVCKAGVKLLEAMGASEPYVSVMESDGTTFVLYGHPSYPDACTEV